ncbi:MAG: HEPN domain-containing protein [Candidatus Freyarchaeota archaeon]|nr:HEPN domain-containing protein [Candidatus Jordarchaeia archaeon]MBS7267858.1 HEPN domain-containing protein [Candidatus Jordarchaeia archaeon]MBS7280951.1 HEPN domain-containing protein [Candidatus Jordarchaeia archaeon]
MKGRESRLPQDWFRKGEADIRTAEILLNHGGDPEIAASHLQQALEKYLKGYLLSKGWQLEHIHDLTVLLDEAVKHKPELQKYREFLEEVTAYYFQSRYPIMIQGPKKEEVEKALTRTKEIVQILLKETK